MTVYFHTALKVLTPEFADKHVTTMFSEFTGKGKFSTSTEFELVPIKDIVFWKDAGVVVAIVESGLAEYLHSKYTEMGYEYDYEFIPHMTLEKTNIDTSEKYKHLIGQQIKLGEEYFKPMYKD